MLKGMINKVYLAVAVLGLFGGAFGANVEPFVFEDIAADHDSQQAQFDYMLKYKLFGRDYLTIGNDVVIPDKSGWNGTRGNITTNARLSLGGMTLAGGGISVGDQCQLTSGPIHAQTLTSGNDNGQSLFGGTVCLANTSVSDAVKAGILRASGTLDSLTSTCPNLPEAPENLSIPVISWPDSMTVDINIPDRGVEYIDIPDGDGTYDYFVKSIHTGTEDTLYIRMQDGGRLTRIFVQDLSIRNHTAIRVVYRTDEGDVVQAQDKYRGNLMFYTNQDISIINSDDWIMQGTYITTGKIYLACNIDFAGQLLANQLEIGNKLKGENFRFVPFDPPILDIKFPELGEDGGLRENDQTVSIPISLDTNANVDVYFTYCFDLRDGVELSDFNYEETDFPVCGESTPVRVKIPEGELVADRNIEINVKVDDLVELNDWLVIKIEIESGAVLPGNKTSGELKVRLIDADSKITPSFDTTKVYSEKENYTGSVDIIAINNKTDSTTLTLDSAYAGRYSLDPTTGVLTLLTAVNYEVTQVDTIKVTLQNGSDSPITRYFPITVIDVNEKPTVADAQFTVDENATAGTFVGKVVASDPDVINLTEYGKLTYSLEDSTAGMASKFTIDGSGNIRVASGATLDYETMPAEFYVKVVVKDPQGLSATAAVTITLKDVDENPKIVVDDDNDGDDDTEEKCVANCTTDNRGSGPNNILTVGVEENVPDNTVVFEYVVSDEDRDEVTRLTPTLRDNNGTGVDSLFGIKMEENAQTHEWKVVVFVKDSSKLDFENIKTDHEVTVIVTDSTGKADSIVRVIRIIDVNELPILAHQEFELDEHKDAGTVVGEMESGDLDKASGFTQNTFTAVAGDTAFFSVTSDGKIVSKKEFDYETERTTYEITVALTDKNDPTLTVTETMKIEIKNKPEAPHITDTEFEVKENVPDSTEIGTITSKDPDGEDDPRTYKLVEESDFVIVTEDGRILVKDSTKFDYETVTSVTIKVSVTDQDNLSSDTLITIKLVDVNEAPDVPDQTITVKEDAVVGSDVGKIAASDPDTAKAFSTLTYELVEESEQFSVKEDGTVVLKKELDYETDSVYVIKVRVTDGDLADTALVTVKVGNVVEKTELEITRAEAKRNGTYIMTRR